MPKISLGKFKSVQELLRLEKVFNVVVSGTWLSDNKSVKVNGYNIFRKDLDHGYGGLVILVHNCIKSCSE